MTTRTFKPGFRLSVTDVLVLVAGGVASGYAMMLDLWLGIAIAFVVTHFFLFCNVLRMSRPLELVWAGIFASLGSAAIVWGVPSWPIVLLISMVVTVMVAFIELRRPSYHGLGWRRVNPRLPEWWEANKMGGRG